LNAVLVCRLAIASWGAKPPLQRVCAQNFSLLSDVGLIDSEKYL